jgi:hypothetical protein
VRQNFSASSWRREPLNATTLMAASASPMTCAASMALRASSSHLPTWLERVSGGLAGRDRAAKADVRTG